MPHAAGPRIPEYHSTDTDVNRPSKTQNQRRTKAACLQKILKLMPDKAKRKKGAKEGKRTRKARNKERRQFSIQKIVQRAKSLTYSVIRKAGN